MHFEEYVEDNDLFCEKYDIAKYGGIRFSNTYPFIFLISNPNSSYKDDLDVRRDGSFSEVRYQVSVNQMKINRKLEQHKSISGVYYSIFLFQKVANTLRFLGEYTVVDTEKDNADRIEYFILEKLGNDGLEDEEVYYVEKSNIKGEEEDKGTCRHEESNRLEISKLGDRSDAIDGIYGDEEDEIIDVKNINVQEGMFLDNNRQIIDLSRVINTENLTQNEQGILSLQFVISENATLAEKRLSQHLFMLSNLNTYIQKQALNYEIEEEKISIDKAFLYTVNVGCALTNFLVIGNSSDTEVWVLDWGSGWGDTSDAKKNIKRCIERIRQKFFGGKKFFISKLFLSHPHSDHYNRIDEKMINADTEIWYSGYNLIEGRIFNKINKLKSISSKFVLPITRNCNNVVKVLHPDQPIVFGNANFSGCGYYFAKKANNTSPIIQIDLDDKICVFPGDIEKNGWDWYKSAGGNGGNNVTVYMHSHHGSKTGFISNIPNVRSCEYDSFPAKIDVLSTKEGVYSGIICTKMKNANKFKVTYRTDQLLKIMYYEIDILSEKVVAF